MNCLKDKRKFDANLLITLTPEEIATAEKLWVIQVQKELDLQRDFDSMRCQFDLFPDQKGIWRCGGRLQNANLPFTANHLILLPRKHPFTALVTCDAHLHVGHNGVKETLTKTRQKYWIVRGQSLIRAIIHRCTTCKKHEGAPLMVHHHRLCWHSGLRKTQPSPILVLISQALCSFETNLPGAVPRCGSVDLLA